MDIKAGQSWIYSRAAELGESRLVIGAIVEFGSGLRIACCSVVSPAPHVAAAATAGETIAFLPLAEDALRRSVEQLDGEMELPADFFSHLEAWQNDPRGTSYFTVPFEGSLDRLIALQMAALVKPDDPDPDA